VRRALRFGAIVVVGGSVLAAAGCGGSSHPYGAGTTTTAAAVSNTVETIPPPTAELPTTTSQSVSATTTAVSDAEVANTLLRLDSPGKDFPPHCSTLDPSSANWPRWSTNALTVIGCTPTDLPNGVVLGVAFSSPNDLFSSLAAYNGVLLMNPKTADGTCPPSSGPSGFVAGGGRGGSSSVLECRRFEGANRPDYIWTNVESDKNELWVALGPVGMSDPDMKDWWVANAK
jgi:hypothetical protein